MEVGGDTIKALEKQIRILSKKLERSEADRRQLEDVSEKRETILRGVIRELEASQLALESRTNELEVALRNLTALQMKLIESEKMSALRVLVAGIAHEINNPVNFVHGNLSYLTNCTKDLLALVQAYQQEVPEPSTALREQVKAIDLDFLSEDLAKLVNSMQTGTRRIQEIVLSLRNFSRLDESEFKPADLHQGINNTLLILHHRFEATSGRPAIQIIKEYGDLPLVECYAGQLNQVFLHLLSNAIDAIEEKAQNYLSTSFNSELDKLKQKQFLVKHEDKIQTIWIRTAMSDSRHVRITIADNGIGIPNSVRSQLFDPFFTTKVIGKGTGLGLSISYQIITEKHRGKLWCDSNSGEETRFCIEIPVRQTESKNRSLPIHLVKRVKHQ